MGKLHTIIYYYYSMIIGIALGNLEEILLAFLGRKWEAAPGFVIGHDRVLFLRGHQLCHYAKLWLIERSIYSSLRLLIVQILR